MRNGNSNRQRRSTAAFARTLTLTLALAMAWSAGSAFAADDEEDVPLDSKIIRQFLKDLGLRQDGDEIEYRERAPLVVPPSRNLPPPQSDSVAASNPAWPKDPDVKQRKLDAAKKKQPNKSAAEAAEAEARPLPRDQLERGRSQHPGRRHCNKGCGRRGRASAASERARLQELVQQHFLVGPLERQDRDRHLHRRADSGTT